MTDNIRPIKVHPRTAEVMREIGMALTEMVDAKTDVIIDENVPNDPQLAGIAIPKNFPWQEAIAKEGFAYQGGMECPVCGDSSPHDAHVVVGATVPEGKVVTVQAGGIHEDDDQNGDRKRLDDLIRLDEFLRETPGTGSPIGQNSTVDWAIDCIKDLLTSIREFRKSNETLVQAAISDEQLQRIGQLATENAQLKEANHALNSQNRAQKEAIRQAISSLTFGQEIGS